MHCRFEAVTLTTGVDVITGTSGDDTFVGTWSESGANVLGGTLNLGDSLNGAAGVDTLKVTVSNTLTAAGATTITGFKAENIEKVFVTAFGSTAGHTTTYDATTTREGVEFWNDGSAVNVTFSNIQKIAAIGVAGNSTANTTATLLDSLVTGAKDTGTVALNNAGTATAGGNVTINGATTAAAGFEIVNVVSTGSANRVNVLASGTNAIQEVNISGSANVRIENVNSTALKSIDASGLKNGAGANVNATASASTALKFVGSAGNDRLVVDGTNAANTFSFNGGEGRDTLAVADAIAFVQGAGAANATLVGTVNKAVGFEVLEAGSATTRAIKANDFTSINEFLISQTATATLSLTGVETADKFTLGANQAGAAGAPGTAAINITGAGPGQTANITLSATSGVAVTGGAGAAGTNAGGAAIDFGGGITTLAIESAGSAANSITGGAGNTTGADGFAINNGTSVQAVTITGSQALSILAGTGATTAELNSFSNSISVNASSLTGKLTIAGSAQSDAITVGSGGSEVRSTLLSDTITLGSGNDTYVLRDLAHTLSAVTDDTAILNSIDKLIGWGAGTDKLNVATVTGATTANYVVAEYVAQNVVQAAVDAVGPTSLLQAAQAAAANLGADKIGAFQYGGNTYVLAQDNAAAFAATDGLIQIAGTHTLTADSFVFA